MGQAPVSACLIVRDEAAVIENCLKSIRPYVSQIVVIDTGSVDSTPEIIRKYADITERYTDCNDSQGRILDFSDARNRSFSHANQPWIMWVDGDDEVVGAEKLNELISRYNEFAKISPVTIMMPYEYSHDANGVCNFLQYRERIITPKSAYKWVNQVHEVIIPIVDSSQQFKDDSIKWVHHRDKSKKTIEPGRNLRILKDMYVKYGESDARHLYYLGLEYGNNGFIDDSLKFLRDILNCPDGTKRNTWLA